MTKWFEISRIFPLSISHDMLCCIQRISCSEKVWIRDIPMTATDKSLAQILGKFGEIDAIVMDRQQSLKHQKWMRHKQEELRRDQEQELHKTIDRLKVDLTRNMVNDYQV